MTRDRGISFVAHCCGGYTHPRSHFTRGETKMEATQDRVTVACPKCGYEIRLSLEAFEQARGKKAGCRKCGETFRVGGEGPLARTAGMGVTVDAASVRRAPNPVFVSIPSTSDLPAPLPLPEPVPAPLSAARPEFQCAICTGWFNAQSVYTSSSGYICKRCHAQSSAPAPAQFIHQPPPQQSVVVNNIINAPAQPIERWNPGVAALLSFIFPGLGQMYKGQVINGLCWMIVVGIGYVMLIIPGLILHLCCIIGAATGDRFR